MSESITSYGDLIAELNRGAFADELDQELSDDLERLRATAIATSGKVKGELTVKLKIQVTSAGLITIDPDVKSNLPKPIREQDSFHLTKSGALSRKNEKQQGLPFAEAPRAPVDIREVPNKRELKEAK